MPVAPWVQEPPSPFRRAGRLERHAFSACGRRLKLTQYPRERDSAMSVNTIFVMWVAAISVIALACVLQGEVF
jgi:hypothetical protein